MRFVQRAHLWNRFINKWMPALEIPVWWKKIGLTRPVNRVRRATSVAWRESRRETFTPPPPQSGKRSAAGDSARRLILKLQAVTIKDWQLSKSLQFLTRRPSPKAPYCVLKLVYFCKVRQPAKLDEALYALKYFNQLLINYCIHTALTLIHYGPWLQFEVFYRDHSHLRTNLKLLSW